MSSTTVPSAARAPRTIIVRGGSAPRRRRRETRPTPRPANRSMSESAIADLGIALDEDGLQAHRELVLELARQASPIAPVAAGVLASETEPDVARLRAFAVVASALVRKIATPAGPLVGP